MRRPRVDWMRRSDDAILEFLLNEPARPLVASPRVISANIDYAHSTVTKRVRILENHGLIAYYDEQNALYQITDRGEAYLAGELAAEDLEADAADGA